MSMVYENKLCGCDGDGEELSLQPIRKRIRMAGFMDTLYEQAIPLL